MKAQPNTSNLNGQNANALKGGLDRGHQNPFLELAGDLVF